jgi:hypothetical protein
VSEPPPQTTAAPSQTTAAPSPTAPEGSTPQCLDPGVEVSVGEVDGALGLRAVGITLRNCGAGNYSVDGYPVIEVLDADRTVLAVTVYHGTENVSRIERYAGPPKRIDVAPGGSVVAVLVWRNVTTDAATVAKGAYVRVAPAGGQPPHTLALDVDPGNTGKLAVSPWSTPNP